MYKYPLLVLMACLMAFAAKAQTRTTVKGTVIDSASKQPIEYATVAILNAKDTTAAALINYAQTNKDGKFTLQNLPINIALKVVVTFAANKSYIKFFSLTKGQTMDMATVKLGSHQLNEVVIRGERMPIRVSKDTIEFDAGAFKTRPNAMVEDLLKKLPGVEVDNSGKITVLGRDVTKILVDGREFFSSDIRIASKNLEADLIAKVQVYDDREEDPQHMIPDNEIKKIINLKFKKELKKSVFGKIYAGAGTQDHYQTGGLINMFRDTLQISLLGYTNNLNSTGFNYTDLDNYGGARRGGEAFGGLGYGSFSGGKQIATYTGVNINTDYGKKLKVNINYLFKHTKSTYSSLTNTQRLINDTTATTASMSDRLNNADTHTITGSVYYKPSEATQYRYNPTIDILKNDGFSSNSSNSYTNFINPINNSVNGGNSYSNGYRFRQTFYFNHYLKKRGSTFTINHSLSINPGNNGHNFDNQNLVSYLSTLPSYSLLRRGDNQSRNASGSVTAKYSNTINKKLNIDISGFTEYNNDLDKTSTYDYNPVTGEYDSYLLMLSSDLNRIRLTEMLSPAFTYKFTNDLNLNSTFNTQFQQVNNVFKRGYNDINQNFVFFMPNIGVRYKSYFLSYNRYVQLPNIGDMIPYSIVYSPLSSVTGNPNLKPTESDRFNLSYSKYDFQKGVNIFLFANVSFEHNSIFRQRTINSQLAETSMPINRNGKYSSSLNGTYSKQIKKQKEFQLTLSTNVSVRQNHDFFVINRQDGHQDSYSGNFSQRINLNFNDIIQLEPSYTVSQVYTTYSGVNYNNQSNLTHNADTHFLFYLPKKFNLEGNYSYNYNPRVPPGYQKSSNFLNLNLARTFLSKDRGEIKLSCYDILNQNISNYRYIYENTVTDTQSQIIKRYFMLTLQIRFNKSTMKGDVKPEPKKMIPVRSMFGF
jgi:hypothetical protein